MFSTKSSSTKRDCEILVSCYNEERQALVAANAKLESQRIDLKVTKRKLAAAASAEDFTEAMALKVQRDSEVAEIESGQKQANVMHESLANRYPAVCEAYARTRPPEALTQVFTRFVRKAPSFRAVMDSTAAEGRLFI